MADKATYERRFIGLLVLVVAGLFFGAFAVPRLLNSNVVAGEQAAIQSLINVSVAEGAYRERYPQIGFAPAVAALSSDRTKHCEPTPEHLCVLDYNLARNRGRAFRGYYFADSAGQETPRSCYTVIAVPAKYGRTGRRAFCVVESGVPRYRDLDRDADPHAMTREQCLRDFTPLP